MYRIELLGEFSLSFARAKASLRISSVILEVFFLQIESGFCFGGANFEIVASIPKTPVVIFCRIWCILA
jgi:hypothetical protein